MNSVRSSDLRVGPDRARNRHRVRQLRVRLRQPVDPRGVPQLVVQCDNHVRGRFVHRAVVLRMADMDSRPPQAPHADHPLCASRSALALPPLIRTPRRPPQVHALRARVLR